MKKINEKATELVKITLVTLTFLMIFVVPPASLVTHIINCLLNEKYLLLIIGVIAFPVGIIHGIGIWFGVNW
ncbi:hypothetical protein [Ectothiorhodospira shaposhnikovii]|uniref:hypothetical protein n=1 Tax=Ectothiorhodospira shaposhnikovii TaxID=1054 RepID=UPI001EE7B0DE|nr:hypothetical protein [Ectothiorhodospira shaposhnikovii]MCG5512834.1 hypothetical protein [Ectothiorhodospira shaposhnikovii]